MRAVAVALLVPVLVSMASAQPKGPPAKTAATTVHYFDLSGLMDDVGAEATLRETRQGSNVTAAVIDVCYPLSSTSNRKDRFVVNLAAQGGKLTGTGQTQFGKEPVSVQLLRTNADQGFTFESVIKIGPTEYKGISNDNTDLSEEEYRDNHHQDEVVVPSPPAFVEQSPGTVGARVTFNALGALVDALKGERARVRLESLQPDCQALRAGSQAILIEVDPMRSAALVTKLRGVPGVVLAGWTAGSYFIDNALRLSAADFGGANLDRDKLASALAAAAAKLLSATVSTVKWDDVSGELSVKLKRPSQSFAGLKFTDEIDLAFLAGPEKPGSAGSVVVWLGATSIETNDEGPEPRLKLVQIPQGEGSPGGDNIDVAALLAALARDLKGQTWDGDAKAWK